MGTLTLSDLISEVRDHLGGRTDSSGGADAKIIRALNVGQEYLARSHDFEELRRLVQDNLVTDDKFLAFTELPAGSQNPHEIYSFRIITGDGQSRKLTYHAPRQFDKWVPEPQFYAGGIPDVYTVWDEKFEFWRVPDDTYNFDLRMSVWPTAFSSGDTSAKSDFREKDDLLVFLAVSWIFGSLGEYDRMRMFFGIYRTRFEEAEGEDMTKPDKEIVSPHGKARPDVVLGRPWADPFVRFYR